MALARTADQPHLYCDQEWTFVRQVKAGKNITHLVTRDGTASYDVFYRAAMAAGGTWTSRRTPSC
ncbi:hypothetical protein GXW82_44460 [Streptacidiphilus sp. 4-A2]|nr:hypothetical protein [Streptacidiphilus sp. 4-A2]